MQGQQANIPYDGKVILYKQNGNTGDIIQAIKAGDAMSIDYVRDFAETMRGADVAETCANLFYFLTSHVPFIEDKGKQVIQLPGAVYENRYASLGGTGNGADCKSFSLFCSSVLRALGNYEFYYRFISESANTPVHHVYLIVKTTGEDGSECYIPLDCTLENFAVEVNYAKKKDMQPTHPVDAPRVGEFNLIKVGAIGNTVQEAAETYWNYETEELKKNYFGLRATLKQNILNSLKNEYLPAHPIKFSAITNKVFKSFDTFIEFGSTIIYHYWNSKSLLSYTACQVNYSSPQNIPFPANYAEKKATADDFHAGLIKLGLRENDILNICHLGTYAKYGIGIEYMLYRCYCIELYGQPFKPQPGVPYFNAVTGVFQNNGADLNDSFRIMFCMPAQGGVGRPFGEPYWSMGGNIVLNGASPANAVDGAIGVKINMDEWVKNNPKPGTPIDGDVNNVVPGYIIKQLTAQEQNEMLVVYNQWALGNMVMLPQPTGIVGQKLRVSGMQPHIGIPIVAIIPIIVAVIGVISAVLKMLDGLGLFNKKGDDISNVPLPFTDFKWDYQTTDGCIVGHNVSDPSVGYVKMCNGEIVATNINPNDPANQPPDPGNFFTGTAPANKKLLIGAAATLAIGSGLLLSNKNN